MVSKVKLKPIAEQVVVITGATSGIGLVTARLAAGRGASVMLLARDEDTLREVVAGIQANGGTAAYAVADVGDEDQVRAAAEQAIATFGRIDGWVNDAGVAVYSRLIDTPTDEHERLFRTNYWGVVNGSLAAVRHLREHGGAVVNLGSIGSDIASPVLSAYAASKAAVKAFTHKLQEELQVDGLPVAVTLLRPSGVGTPLAEHAAVHLEGDARLPHPFYDPSVVAEAILNALQHERGDVIVGGTGHLLIFLSHVFPGLHRLLARSIWGNLEDRAKEPHRENGLYEPIGGARERTDEPPAFRSSLVTAAGRYPWLAATVLAAGAATTVAYRKRRPRRRS